MPDACSIHEQGAPALFAGGAVRDILLGVAPQDYDVAAGLGTEDLLALFPDAKRSRNAIGTVMLRWPEGAVEITPLRSFGAAPAGAFWDVNLGRRATLHLHVNEAVSTCSLCTRARPCRGHAAPARPCRPLSGIVEHPRSLWRSMAPHAEQQDWSSRSAERSHPQSAQNRHTKHVTARHTRDASHGF